MQLAGRLPFLRECKELPRRPVGIRAEDNRELKERIHSLDFARHQARGYREPADADRADAVALGVALDRECISLGGNDQERGRERERDEVRR